MAKKHWEGVIMLLQQKFTKSYNRDAVKETFEFLDKMPVRYRLQLLGAISRQNPKLYRSIMRQPFFMQPKPLKRAGLYRYQYYFYRHLLSPKANGFPKGGRELMFMSKDQNHVDVPYNIAERLGL